MKRLHVTAGAISADRVGVNIRGDRHQLVAAIDFEKAITWSCSSAPAPASPKP